MKTPAQLTEILEALIESGKATFRTVMMPTSEMLHELNFPAGGTSLFKPKFNAPMKPVSPHGEQAPNQFLYDTLDHLLTDSGAKVRVEVATNVFEDGASEALFLKEVLETGKVFEKRPAGTFATPGSNLIEVYYHTREAVEYHQGLYAQVTFSPNQASVSKLVELGLYEKAAVIVVPQGEDVHTLEVAFEKTQNIHASWTQNENVIAVTDRPRSSMMGDVMVVNGKPYVVAMMGFKELESFQPFPESKVAVVKAMDVDGDMGSLSF